MKNQNVVDLHEFQLFDSRWHSVWGNVIVLSVSLVLMLAIQARILISYMLCQIWRRTGRLLFWILLLVELTDALIRYCTWWCTPVLLNTAKGCKYAIMLAIMTGVQGEAVNVITVSIQLMKHFRQLLACIDVITLGGVNSVWLQGQVKAVFMQHWQTWQWFAKVTEYKSSEA